MKKTLAFCFFLSQLIINAQEINPQLNSCGSDQINRQFLQDHPELAAKMAAYENAVQNRKFSAKSPASSVYRIPVVVHIMHKGEAVGVGTNLSDDAIKAKIKAINEQFRHIPGSSGDGSGVDMEIEFVLAVVDPQGNQTNGIDRYNMNDQAAYMANGINYYNSNGISQAALKALAFWDSTLYYNMWVVSEIDNNEGRSGIMGYALYAFMHGTAGDGFFIVSNSFADPLSRMETHELGHAVNLYHTFEGDNDGASCPSDSPTAGDFCADTAPHKRATGDCTVTSNPCYPDNTDLSYLHNYMNYIFDGCRNMFTADQKNRAITAMTTLRTSFSSTASMDKLRPVAPAVAGFLPAQPVIVTTGSSLELSDASTGVPSNYLNNYSWPGISFNWSVSNGNQILTATDQNPILNFTEEGIYNISHDVNNGLGTSSKTANHMIYVVAPATELPATTLTSTASGNCGNNYMNLNTIEKTMLLDTNTVYADYINTDKTVLISGNTYPLTFNTKADSQYSEYFAVYIDWNGNGTFEESEKLGTTSIAAGTAVPRTVEVFVPTNCIKNKLLRLRIVGNARDAITNDMVNGKAPFFIGDTKDFGIYVIDSQDLGTEDFDLTNLSYYPNPVKDILNINYTESVDKVEIYNLVGQQLISQDFQNPNIQLDLSRLAPGAYITSVYAGGKKASIKILKN